MGNFCTNRPGPCVRLTKTSGAILGFGGGTNLEWVVPFFDETKFTATQKLRQPVKEFFDDLKDFIVNSGGVGGGIADIIFKGLDLFGVQLFRKDFYIQAWTGEEPTPFSLTLKFFLGMQGKWDALAEVYEPVMTLMQQTVPQEPSKNVLTSPAPSPFSAFTSFAETVISAALAQGGAVAQAVSILGVNGKNAASTLKNLSSQILNQSQGGGSWAVEFGWTDGVSHNAPKIYFKIPSTIVESSTWSFSPAMQSINGRVYPISGELQLNFRTQSIITSPDLKDNQANQGT